MSLLILLQVAVDLIFIAVATLYLMDKVKNRNGETPQLSRGLQLLSSKIAIIQDLMDRAEQQSKELGHLLDSKQSEVQEKLEDVEMSLNKISMSIEKSKQVAAIFQDRIPHQEIIERQNTYKYIKAAKLAHQGISAQEIAKQVDIPAGELELIVKLNRDRLVVEDVPAWIDDPQLQNKDANQSESAPVVVQAQISPEASLSGTVEQPVIERELGIRPVIFKNLGQISTSGGS
ncbi:MAG: DUF2802 domain-containing protein [Oligoflexia bacterium]|nr:DUF2802 domain-containing protein [Oligoflexia bacterium]